MRIPVQIVKFICPEGYWELMVTETVASDAPISVISGIVKIPPFSGVVLRRRSEQNV